MSTAALLAACERVLPASARGRFVAAVQPILGQLSDAALVRAVVAQLLSLPVSTRVEAQLRACGPGGAASLLLAPAGAPAGTARQCRCASPASSLSLCPACGGAGPQRISASESGLACTPQLREASALRAVARMADIVRGGSDALFEYHGADIMLLLTNVAVGAVGPVQVTRDTATMSGSPLCVNRRRDVSTC